VRVAETICATLPVCSLRKISYATFTIADITSDNSIKIIEYDNPTYLHYSSNGFLKWHREKIEFKSGSPVRNNLYFSHFKFKLGDRIIFFSDGVTQSGLGSKKYPLGYGEEIENFIDNVIKDDPGISAQDLAEKITLLAQKNDCNIPKDDISCVVIYFRKPRKAILVTGPPVEKSKDSILAKNVNDFIGEKIICGGTTANILAREWNREISVPLRNIDFTMPPMGKMDGVNLISEGIITLGKVSEYLEKGIPENCHPKNPAYLIVKSILKRDKIRFLVGTKINDAHQDPDMPVELEIRRNIVKQINRLLMEKYLKETELIFI
ncbi:MAG: SpoIIE family protein phosphatase, partial [Spirochaetales bacterium]|nr:SpoIIE family protein phosphatase [Spirochaetales bacterium]